MLACIVGYFLIVQSVELLQLRFLDLIFFAFLLPDYFNYGFNEDTWRAYCERQKRLRVHESGSGLIPMNQPANVNIIPNVSVPPPNMMGMGMPDVNPGSINVIGNANVRRSGDVFAKENTIQVDHKFIACIFFIESNL